MKKSYTAYKERWNKENYADIRIRIPKMRKSDVEVACAKTGESINGMVNRLLRTEIGMTKSEWGNREEAQNEKNKDSLFNSHKTAEPEESIEKCLVAQ